jgi:phytanoyl-CoA hydroxylase
LSNSSSNSGRMAIIFLLLRGRSCIMTVYTKFFTPSSAPANATRPVRKLMSFVTYDERLKAMAEHPELLSLMRRVMDGEPDLFQDMALLKGPGGREKPWHQDCAYFDIAIGTPVIGIWIALDEASEENGCLHILPGTHREGPSEHFKVRDWQICDSSVQTKRSVTVPLPPAAV